MANMLYNGVELPALPELDEETYQHLVIFRYSSGSGYSLIAHTSAPTIVDVAVSATKTEQYVRFSSGSYLYFTFSSDSWGNGSEYVNSGNWDVDKPTYLVWTNTDIITTDGSVYLAASDPVPVGGSSHVTESSGDGYALYNGVKLPNIESVWKDDLLDECPFALIQYSTAYEALGTSLPGFLGQLCLSSSQPYYLDGYVRINAPTTSHVYVYCSTDELVQFLFDSSGISLTSGQWTLVSSDTITEGFYSLTPEPIWASTSVIDSSDGSIKVDHSTPIPLDGMTVIEWDGVTDGLVNFEFDNYPLYKVSDAMLAVDQLSNGVMILEEDGIFGAVSVPESGVLVRNITDGVYAIHTYPYVLSASNPEVESYGLELGTYFRKSASCTVFCLAYPASTEPEEPEDTTKKDFWNGVACGLCGSGTPNFSDTSPFGVGYITGCKLRALRERKPIAYLYNGVQLPPLPEWDREAYPYAAIYYQDVSSIFGGEETYRATLYLCENPITYTAPITGYFTSSGSYFDGKVLTYTWASNEQLAELDGIEGANVWCNYRAFEYDNERHLISLSWTNHDIVYTNRDGVHLAASDPVPVYE